MEQLSVLVSIKCLAYNHEPYIRECLEGFVMQQTNFRFEAIVHDDASTDGTADIIREYAEKYPEIIKPIFETENQYSKHDGSLGRIMREACTGKYIAMCEGDDYWTDPLKLQKQVDFLEEHEDYSMCFHKCKTLIQQTGKFVNEQVKDISGESTIFDLAKGNYVHTPSVVYRRNDRIEGDRAKLPHNLAVGDYVLWMLLAQYGKIMKLPDEMAVYRFGVGVWSPRPLSYTTPRWCEVLMGLIEYFESAQPQISELLNRQMFCSIESSLKDLENACSKKDSIRYSYAYRLGKFILYPASWIKRKISRCNSCIL